MFAVYAESFDAENPVDGLRVGDLPEPTVPDGWTTVTVKAASVNHHDVWSLQGVGLQGAFLPMILGCDAAGVDADGHEVIVHAIIGDPDWMGDETLDPKRTILSERHAGTFAEKVAVPRRNLLPKPTSLSFAEAACLPTAWLTAYRMLFGHGVLQPGDSVLIQGAGGGVATALIALGRAAGLRVIVTSRDEDKRAKALGIGAHEALPAGQRLAEKVDAVMETVGAATWKHSIRSVKPGGAIVVAGATSGDASPAELAHVFFLQKRVIGSTMGTREELRKLVNLLDATGVRPLIDTTYPMSEAATALARLAAGDVFGKLVLTR